MRSSLSGPRAGPGIGPAHRPWQSSPARGDNVTGEGKKDGKGKGTDLFISLFSRPAPLPIFDPPSDDRLYFANEAFGSRQLPPLQCFADYLPLAHRYRTANEFRVARCPFIVGKPQCLITRVDIQPTESILNSRMSPIAGPHIRRRIVGHPRTHRGQLYVTATGRQLRVCLDRTGAVTTLPKCPVRDSCRFTNRVCRPEWPRGQERPRGQAFVRASTRTRLRAWRDPLCRKRRIYSEGKRPGSINSQLIQGHFAFL